MFSIHLGAILRFCKLTSCELRFAIGAGRLTGALGDNSAGRAGPPEEPTDKSGYRFELSVHGRLVTPRHFDWQCIARAGSDLLWHNAS